MKSAAERELDFEQLDEAVFLPAEPVRRRDYLSVIEAAYDLGSDDRAWLVGLTSAVSPILDRGLGVAGFFWDISHARKHRVSLPVFVGCAQQVHEAFKLGASRLTPKQASALYQRSPCKLIQTAETYPRAYAAYRSRLDAEGMLLVSAANLSKTGCGLVGLRAGHTTASPALGRALDQVARHVAA